MKKIFFSIALLTLVSSVHFAVESPEATSNYSKGKKLYDAKQYAEAYPLLLKAAEAGNAEAMMHLGKMYYNGWGVLHNHDTGRKWHEKAAALGNAESREKLKTMDMHEHH